MTFYHFNKVSLGLSDWNDRSMCHSTLNCGAVRDKVFPSCGEAAAHVPNVTQEAKQVLIPNCKFICALQKPK